MLSEEEKKAIRNLENLSEYGLSTTLNQADLDKMKTVLNIITKLQKENEKYKYLYQKALDNTIKSDRENIELKKENEQLKITVNKQSIDISNNLLELQQKDKKIDLMAEYWNTGLAMCDNCDKIVEKYEENTCKECIKQYFETKAKKGE